jgi:hypothetical protein
LTWTSSEAPSRCPHFLRNPASSATKISPVIVGPHRGVKCPRARERCANDILYLRMLPGWAQYCTSILVYVAWPAAQQTPFETRGFVSDRASFSLSLSTFLSFSLPLFLSPSLSLPPSLSLAHHVSVRTNCPRELIAWLVMLILLLLCRNSEGSFFSAQR